MSDERDQHISRRRSNRGIRRSARVRLRVEGVRARAAIDGIERIVDGDVHHRVDARFVEWVGEGGEARRGGGHAGVCVPDDDGIAARSEGPFTFGSQPTVNRPRTIERMIDRLVGCMLAWFSPPLLVGSGRVP